MSKDNRVVHLSNASGFGTCLVFNCVKFDNHPDKARHGSDNDANMIKKTFATLNFDVVIISSPTKEDIKKEIGYLDLKEKSPYIQLTEKKIFVCFILSHGSERDKIYTRDGTIMLKEKVLDKLHNVTTLKHKTKVIVIQACRGKMLDPGNSIIMDTTSVDIVPEYQQVKPIISDPDFFLVFSSTPGYKSIRNRSGTTFIHMFCAMLEEHGSTLTLSELVQRVIFTISCLPFTIQEKNKPIQWGFQIPYFFSTLYSPVFLVDRKTVADNKPKTYEIQDKAIDDERINIIRKLHERANNKICLPKHPVVEEREFLLLVKQTTGSYNTNCNTNTKTRQCLIITSDCLESDKVKLDTKHIINKMRSLHFEVNTKSTTNVFTEMKESTQKTKSVEKQIIDIEAFRGEKKHSINCFLCFIQHTIDECDETDRQISNIICKLKCQTALLDIPKVFILQSYKSGNVTDCMDGEETSTPLTPNPVKSSIESDVLIIYATSVDESDTPTLTYTFCEMLEKNADDYSVIDLLEYLLPNKLKETWTDLRPTFSSTMRKHLVIRKTEKTPSSPQNTNIKDNQTDEGLMQDLKNFSQKIKTDNNIPSKMSNEENNEGDNIDLMQPAQMKLEDHTTWTNTHMVCGYIMLMVCLMLVVLNLIGIVLDVTRYNMFQNFIINTNLTTNDVSLCDNECRRLKIVAFDIIGLTTNSFSTITCFLLLVNIRRRRTCTCFTKKISFPYFSSTAMLFAFNLLSFTLGIAGIAKRLEYDFKDEVILSTLITMLSLVIMCMMAAILYRFLRGNSERIIVI